MKKKKIAFYITAVILVIILLFFFLHQEHICWECKINDAKFNNFFVCLASIFTLSSIAFLYNDFLLKKTEKQPILLFKRSEFYAEDDFIPNPYSRFIKFFPSASDKTTQISPVLELVNSGFGPAYNIKIRWEYNIEEIDAFIQDYYKPFGYQHKEDLESLLMSNDILKIKIPGYFLQTTGPSLGLDSMDKPNQERPTLKATLTYSDAYNRNYEESFVLSADVFYGNVIITSKRISLNSKETEQNWFKKMKKNSLN